VGLGRVLLSQLSATIQVGYGLSTLYVYSLHTSYMFTLLWNRNSSCSSLLVGATSSKKPVSVVSNLIGMKFSRISRIFDLASHFQTGSHDDISRKKCCHLVSGHAACTRRICSSVLQFLIPGAFVQLDQELIPYRYSSCCCCSFWGDLLQN